MSTATISTFFARANMKAEIEENGQKFSISYPLLTIILTVVLYLTGHLVFTIWWMATMQAGQQQLSQKLIEIEGQRQKDREYYQSQLDLHKVYIDTLREKQVKMETQMEKETRRR